MGYTLHNPDICFRFVRCRFCRLRQEWENLLRNNALFFFFCRRHHKKVSPTHKWSPYSTIQIKPEWLQVYKSTTKFEVVSSFKYWYHCFSFPMNAASFSSSDEDKIRKYTVEGPVVLTARMSIGPSTGTIVRTAIARSTQFPLQIIIIEPTTRITSIERFHLWISIHETTWMQEIYLMTGRMIRYRMNLIPMQDYVEEEKFIIKGNIRFVNDPMGKLHQIDLCKISIQFHRIQVKVHNISTFIKK